MKMSLTKLVSAVVVLLNLQTFGAAEKLYDQASVRLKNKSGQDLRARVLIAEHDEDNDAKSLQGKKNQHDPFDDNQKKIARGWLIIGKGSTRFTQPGKSVQLPFIVMVTNALDAKHNLPRQYFYIGRGPHKNIELEIEKGKNGKSIIVKAASGSKIAIEELNFGIPLKEEIIKKHEQALKDLGFDVTEYLTVQQIFNLTDDATVDDIKAEIKKQYDHYKNNKVPQFQDRVGRIIALLRDVNDSYDYTTGISDDDLEKKMRSLDIWSN
ncbi:hypothetical protein KJZ61_04225 [Candidatus Dependentiae bacterium]|nr:hypothetical protein [Candidatus Dependentiae bacterium]